MIMRNTVKSTLLVVLLCLSTLAAGAAAPMDSRQLEKALQGLDWPQFRTVIEAIPELRREVDKYGPLGWDYVKTRYRTHGWKKNIDKLDPAERQRLARLVEEARKIRR